MNDKSELLNQLRLDRESKPPRSRRSLWWGLLALLVAAIVLGVGLLLRQPEGIPVSVVSARAPAAGTNASALDASGYVVARRQATVAAKITAKVTEIMIEEGQHVTQGQIMARLDDSNSRAALAQAEAQLAQAEANLAAARQAFEDERPIFARSRDLNGKGWVSGADFDQEQAKFDAAQQAVNVSEASLAVAKAVTQVAQRNQEDTLVRAPYDGIITVKAAQPGEVVSPLSAGGGFTRTGIGTLVDMDSLEVEVEVSENFIDRVRPGQACQVRLNAYPEWQIPASVIAIIPTADRSKATVKVRVGFNQKDPRILPEMGARVAFLAKPRADDGPAAVGVLLPASAVIGSGDSGAVFVVQGDHVQRRSVRLGARSAGDQVVLRGLAAGEQVAVGDLGQLTDGARIRRGDLPRDER